MCLRTNTVQPHGSCKEEKNVCSVVDPCVLGPPGSESVIICTDPDSSIIKQNLDF
jgi:hypothetical protein